MRTFLATDKVYILNMEDCPYHPSYYKQNFPEDSVEYRLGTTNMQRYKEAYFYWKEQQTLCHKQLAYWKGLKTYTTRYYKDNNFSTELLKNHIREETVEICWWKDYLKLCQEQFRISKLKFNSAQRIYSEYLNEKLLENKRMELHDFISEYEYNAGKGECKGFKAWLCNNWEYTFAKRYPGRAAEDVISLDKKTYNYWRKFFDMYEKGISPANLSKKGA